MTDRKTSNIPFVGLHAHSVASVFDGLGYANEHMDFAFSNGSDALALTDHGSMNGLPYQVLHAKKMNAEGRKFRPIFGIEAYFHPSISQWEKDKAEIDFKKASEKGRKKKDTGEEASGATVEDEQASKSATKNILSHRRHLILLAQNQTGLQNLYRMISKSYTAPNFYRFPRIDYDMLRKNNEGIIASSACLGGCLSSDYWQYREEGEEAVLNAMRKTSQNMLDIFGDRWYGELQWNSIPEQHIVNRLIIQVCNEHNVKLISTADSHYPTPDSWKDRILYKKLGWSGSKDIDTSLPETVDEVGYELYPKNGEQMWESYLKYSKEAGQEYDDDLVRQSLEETCNIAFERIEDFYPDNKVRLPSFVVPKGTTAEEELSKLSNEGLLRIKKEQKIPKKEFDEYKKRLETELEVININGFAGYFLTMKALADRGNEVMLSAPGRGSAAGALVAYVLKITQINPMKYDLLFERFMTKNQKDNGFPDIDHDVSSPMELKELLIKEWGDDTVVPISNWNTLQLRSLIKDIGKFYGVPFTETNVVTGKMLFEATPKAKAANGIKTGVYVPTFDEVLEYSDSLKNFLEKYPHIETHVKKIFGSIKSCSRHAGGCVISEDLDQHMPLINSKGVRQSPWSEGMNVHHLEPMGFIKFDLLGLASLRMMETAIIHILKRYKGIKKPTFKDIREYYDNILHPDKLDLNDQDVYENIFHQGKWIGVFQFSETGAQNFCKQVRPRNIIDLSSVTSIFRPATLAAKVDKEYITSRDNPDQVEYIHPLVEEVLGETYGHLIFQEQIAKLAHLIGQDLTLDEGNALRKLLIKKGKNEKKEMIRQKFMNGAAKKGISRSDADDLFQKFELYSGYGFNKSHACSYSVLSYQCAWLLNYYPECWTAAFLDKEPEAKKEKAISIAKSHGFKIKPLDVNASGEVWEISEDGETLIQPLTSIKGFGEKAMKEILDFRPFKTIEELLFHPRVSYSKLNKKNIDVLCRSGALDDLQDERFTGSKHFWTAVAVLRPRNVQELEANIADDIQREEGSFSKEERIGNLTDLTGQFPVSEIISEQTLVRLAEKEIPAIGDFDDEDDDEPVVWFIPRSLIKKKTARGSSYLIIECTDNTNQLTKIKCWNYNAKDSPIHINRPYVATLDYSEQWGFSTRSVNKNFRLVG